MDVEQDPSAEEPKGSEQEQAEQKPEQPQGELGPAGLRALQAERAARQAAEKKATDAETALATATANAAKAEADAIRAAVALEKGLTVKQAARLMGTTREELLADADEFLAELPPRKKPVIRNTGKTQDGAKPGTPQNEDDSWSALAADLFAN